MAVPAGKTGSPPAAVRAFVLAAGRGERLRPLTDRIPKPLLPLLGKPVLDEIVDRIMALGIEKVGVNTHHLASMIAERILSRPDREKITVLYEPELLGTGGGIRNALAHLCREGEDLLVHNGDIVSDLDIGALLDAHRQGKSLVTLGVHDHGPTNTLILDDRARLSGIAQNPEPGCAAFTGVAVYRADFVRFLPKGASHVVDGWLAAIREGWDIRAVRMDGNLWTDIGRVDTYAREVFRRMERHGGRIFLGDESTCCAHGEIRGRAVIEKGAALPENFSLEEVILLPGARVLPGQHLVRVVAAEGCTVPLPPEEDAEAGKAEEHLKTWEEGRCWFSAHGTETLGGFSCTRVGSGGSVRRYYRVSSGPSSAILALAPPGDGDHERFLTVAAFLRQGGIQVPRVLAADPEMGRMLLEDLGDRSLYEWVNCRPKPQEVAGTYRKILEQVALLHSLQAPPASAPPSDLVFDEDYFLWESGYFLEQFVGRYFPEGCPRAFTAALERDRREIALAAQGELSSVLHRDLQSQNIMLVGEKLLPVFIDFQGARLGPAAYDVVALLWDPYVFLSSALRERLVDFYVGVRLALDPSFRPEPFRERLVPCRLQRHMQALGAYGFLTRVKGYSQFERFIPPGLALLDQDCAEASPRWSALADLVRECSDRFPFFR